jgi:2,3-bisphosphoglycerate-dependent phosphoglycerate mutase
MLFHSRKHILAAEKINRMQKSVFLFGSLLAILALITMSSSCKKKTETVVETVIQMDTVEVLIQDDATTFILVRHAETTGIGTNPSLSEDGQTRAQALSDILQNVDLHAVYATDFNRTQESAQVTATDQGLPVTEYDPENQEQLVQEVLALNDETVLVVGHSDTVPLLLNILVGSDLYEGLAKDVHCDLFVVHVYEAGNAEVVHLK